MLEGMPPALVLKREAQSAPQCGGSALCSPSPPPSRAAACERGVGREPETVLAPRGVCAFCRALSEGTCGRSLCEGHRKGEGRRAV